MCQLVEREFTNLMSTTDSGRSNTETEVRFELIHSEFAYSTIKRRPFSVSNRVVWKSLDGEGNSPKHKPILNHHPNMIRLYAENINSFQPLNTAS